MAAPVSILIVAYRSARHMARMAEALNALSVRPAQILILENGSPEGERVGPDMLPDGARLIESETNLGFAAGNNRLAEEAEQDWIFLLNPDAFPQPDLIERFMAAVQRFPEASFFGCTQIADGAPGVLDGVGDVYHFTGLPYRAGYGRSMDAPPDGEVFSPCGAASLIRRDVFERLGGFDEDFFCYVEDVDLGARARLTGETCVQVRDAVVSHVGYGSSGRRSEFATYQGARNRLWTFFKLTPGWLLWILVPVHLAATGLLWLSALRFGQFTVFGRAMRDAWTGRDLLLEKRRKLQAERRISISDYAGMLNWNLIDLVRRGPHRLKPRSSRSKSH